MRHTSSLRWAVVMLVVALAGLAQASETVHLYLKIGGKDVQGESTQTSLGRENSIECVQFQHAVAMNGASKVYEPIVIRKRIDKSSPVLIKAVSGAQDCEAVFKFFRPNPTGDGTTEQFYTVILKGARITAVRQFVPNCMDPGSSNYPPQEDVTLSFKSIQWNYTNGVSASDEWKEPRAAMPIERPAMP